MRSTMWREEDALRPDVSRDEKLPSVRRIRDPISEGIPGPVGGLPGGPRRVKKGVPGGVKKGPKMSPPGGSPRGGKKCTFSRVFNNSPSRDRSWCGVLLQGPLFSDPPFLGFFGSRGGFRGVPGGPGIRPDFGGVQIPDFGGVLGVYLGVQICPIATSVRALRVLLPSPRKDFTRLRKKKLHLAKTFPTRGLLHGHPEIERQR